MRGEHRSPSLGVLWTSQDLEQGMCGHIAELTHLLGGFCLGRGTKEQLHVVHFQPGLWKGMATGIGFLPVLSMDYSYGLRQGLFRTISRTGVGLLSNYFVRFGVRVGAPKVENYFPTISPQQT